MIWKGLLHCGQSIKLQMAMSGIREKQMMVITTMPHCRSGLKIWGFILLIHEVVGLHFLKVWAIEDIAVKLVIVVQASLIVQRKLLMRL